MQLTVACIGFTDPAALANIVRTKGEPLHELSSTSVWRDTSGATLLLDNGATTARPAFTSLVRTGYQDVQLLDNGLARLSLVDATGYAHEPVTVLPDGRYTVGWAPSGRLALVALGIDVEFFSTVEDFFDSPRSALPGLADEPPPEVRQFGLQWPPPMEIQTLQAVEDPSLPRATMSGIVQNAAVHANAESGHEFLVSRVATVIGEVDLCTPVPLDGVPPVGSIAVGQVKLLAGLPPFGVPDESTYQPPEQLIEPNFRDGAPADGEFEIHLDDSQIELPDGLVLGDDGIVRTEAEHREWKAESASDPTAAEAPSSRGEAPQPAEGDESKASTPQPSTPTSSNTDDDDAPRPGETRREWRARTGR